MKEAVAGGADILVVPGPDCRPDLAIRVSALAAGTGASVTIAPIEPPAAARSLYESPLDALGPKVRYVPWGGGGHYRLRADFEVIALTAQIVRLQRATGERILVLEPDSVPRDEELALLFSSV